ncbi:M28 family peptidase [Mumia sp. DW29H23]|uniref:M28 family metallopeptidase n=1 Tax=Mumia sp. DW29H23 TaxID=3421241 RepID=UPI003D68EE38
MRSALAGVALLLAVSACGGSGPDAGPTSAEPAPATSSVSPSASTGAAADGTTSPDASSGGVAPEDTGASPGEPGTAAPSPGVPPKPESPAADVAAMRQAIRHLAGTIGPRLATSASFREAADWFSGEMEQLGYRVTREAFPVPAGDSWGVPVEAGRSQNVIADPPGFDPTRPHLVVGAHLDTVAVSPGAEDNASGVAVVRELGRLAAAYGTRLPVRFVAFGAEEPRGPGDDLHHFGSQHRVSAMTAAEREALRAMVSLDRVGVRGSAVPVCDGGTSNGRVVRSLAAAAGGIPTTTCEDRASDHWSYEKADVPAARLGSIPYAGYHSEGDRPRVVDDRQLRWVATITWRWMR